MNDTNPFEFEGQWYWTDEKFAVRGPYKTYRLALRALLKYIQFLDGYPPFTTRVWNTLKDIWRDESTIPPRHRK